MLECLHVTGAMSGPTPGTYIGQSRVSWEGARPTALQLLQHALWSGMYPLGGRMVEMGCCALAAVHGSGVDTHVTRAHPGWCATAGCLAMPHMAHMLVALVMLVIFVGFTLLMVSRKGLCS